MKAKRQSKILDIIAAHTVTTQEELQNYLAQEGFSATQATISRDIREMRLIKALSPNGTYYYTVPQERKPETFTVNVNSVFMESVKTVDHAGNFVVVKCFTGMANAVRATIDNISWNGLVGTIAGDDTIFLLLRSEHNAEELAAYLSQITGRSSQ